MTEPKSAPKPADAAAVRVIAQDLEKMRGELGTVTELTEEVRRTAAEAKDSSDSAQRTLLELTRTVKRLGDHVRDMEDAVLRSGDDEPPEPRFHWLTVTDQKEADQELRDLAGWVAGVYLRYSGTKLTPCWMLHETVVADLHVLYSGFLDATDGKTGTAFKLMDWHDRYRPSAVQRIDAELAECRTPAQAYEHHVDGGRRVNNPPHVPGVEMGGEVSRWWPTTHATEPAPQPTPDVVQAARKEEADEIRHRHQR
ncbi:hypothetical protein ACFWUU_40325 [Kribbella sp. NPDC058693]|uniref:hypothetical protein n=1 Tax=Kribbella sp. NPDC058693 TaxID=3346602 RepID=UPI00364C31BC